MATETCPSANPATAITGDLLVLKPDVIFLEAGDGSARLLDLGGRFYAVSEVGAELIRESMARGRSAAVEVVAGRYGVDEGRVRADLGAVLEFLRHDRLLGSAGGRRIGGRVAAALLRPALRIALSARPSDAARAWWLLSLAKASFRLFGWARTVELWREGCEGAVLAGTGDAIGWVDRVVRDAASGFPVRVECKERAICCWALLMALGIPAGLVVGVGLFPLEGHCWCEAGGRVLGDYPDRCAEFRVVRVEWSFRPGGGES